MNQYGKISAFFADARKKHRNDSVPTIVRERVMDADGHNVIATFTVYDPKSDTFADFSFVGIVSQLDQVRDKILEAMQ